MRILVAYESQGPALFLKQKQSYSKHEVLKIIKVFDTKVKAV